MPPVSSSSRLKRGPLAFEHLHPPIAASDQQPGQPRRGIAAAGDGQDPVDRLPALLLGSCADVDDPFQHLARSLDYTDEPC